MLPDRLVVVCRHSGRVVVVKGGFGLFATVRRDIVLLN